MSTEGKRKVGGQLGRYRLSSKTERAVLLRDKGMSWRDVAEEIGSTESAVRVMFYRRRLAGDDRAMRVRTRKVAP